MAEASGPVPSIHSEIRVTVAGLCPEDDAVINSVRGFLAGDDVSMASLFHNGYFLSLFSLIFLSVGLPA